MKRALTVDIIIEELFLIITIGNGPIWFLYRFFCVEIIWNALFKPFLHNTKKWYLHLVIAQLVLGIVVYVKGNNILLIVLGSILLCFFEMLIGYYFSIYVYKRINNLTTIKFLISVLLIVLGSYLSISYNISINYKKGSFSDLLYSNIVAIMLPIGFFLLVDNITMWCKGFKFIKEIEFMGENSLIILGVHPIILLFFSYPFSSIINTLPSLTQIVIALSVLIILIIFTVFVSRVLKKHLPFCVGLIR